MASNQKSSSGVGNPTIAADGFTSRSAPIPIPTPANHASRALDELPSPTASLSGDKYILVRAPKPSLRVSQLAEADVKVGIVKPIPATTDLKSELCTPPLNVSLTSAEKSGEVNLARLSKLMTGHPGGTPLKVRLWFATQLTSAAATPQAAVIAIDPSVSTEFSALASLFSEFRVMPDVVCHYQLGWNSGAPNLQMMVIAYDPSQGTALTSVVNGLESSQAQLHGFGPSYTYPATFNAVGYRKFAVKLLSGVVTNGSVAGLASAGQWQSTNSVAPKYGYLRTYIPNGPAGVTSTFQAYTYMDCEFRSRL